VTRDILLSLDFHIIVISTGKLKAWMCEKFPKFNFNFSLLYFKNEREAYEITSLSVYPH
jgi:hypothetical protein